MEQQVGHPTRRVVDAVEELTVGLGAILPTAPASELISVLHKRLPIAAGFLECFRTNKMAEPTTAPIALPESVLAEILTYRPEDNHTALEALAQCPPGLLLASDSVMTEEEWKHVDGYQALQKQGYGGVGAMVMDSCLKGEVKEITYIALMLEQGTLGWSSEDRQIMEAVAAPLRSAVRRLSFSLLQRETILVQLADEQNLGLIVLDDQKRVREANRRAWVWSQEFATQQSSFVDEVMSTFAEAILEQPKKEGAIRRVFSYSKRIGELEIWEHLLDPTEHELPAAGRLLILRQLREASSAWRELSPQLSPRCAEIAEMLATPGATAQSIATVLGISPRTVESHILTIYKTLGARSRTEFIAIFRGY